MEVSSGENHGRKKGKQKSPGARSGCCVGILVEEGRVGKNRCRALLKERMCPFWKLRIGNACTLSVKSYGQLGFCS